MSNPFVTDHYKIVTDILTKSGYQVYSDPYLGIIVSQPSVNPVESNELDEEMKNRLLGALINSGTPQLVSNDLEQLVTELLKAAPRPLERGLVSRLIVLLLNLYDERTEARLNGSTIEYSDRYQQGYMDLNLEERS